MSDYTPSIHSIESAYCHVQQETLQERGPDAHTKFHAEFCAWLTAYTRQAKEQAWDEGAKDAAMSLDHGGHNATNPYRSQP